MKKNKEDLLKEYQLGVLKPLDEFYQAHYKDLVTNDDKDIYNTLEREYDLYFNALETFSRLVEDNEKNER